MTAFERQLRQFERQVRTDGIGVRAVRESGLRDILEDVDPGLFGTTTVNLAILNVLAAALDRAAAFHAQVIAQLSTSTADGTALRPLSQEERQFAGLFFMRVFCHEGQAGMAALTETALVEGALSDDGLAELAENDAEMLATRLARILTAFVFDLVAHPEAEPVENSEAAARGVHVFFTLLIRAVDAVTGTGRLSALAKLFENRRLTVGDGVWIGLKPTASTVAPSSSLRPVTPEDIVGNRAYLEAGLRLARDVAGYDFEAGRNPKQINPILFALGRPGCGKTLAAHAIGNSFLAYCRNRNIPAQFKVIRKSDWASSYQNASARNLVGIFTELHRFDGVTGIYWADIDTALASRSQAGLRAEEKANLSAAFNVFDGTLIPFDGKWFIMADANNLEMDAALRTRIAKNPFYVKGPVTADDYVRLLRDILLKHHLAHIDADPGAWRTIGELAAAGDISGRGIEGISRQIIDRIQDFAYPDEYYAADFEGRKAIIDTLSNTVTAEAVAAVVERYIAFEKQAEERRAKERFDAAVEEAVFAMNVQKAVVNRLVDAPDD